MGGNPDHPVEGAGLASWEAHRWMGTGACRKEALHDWTQVGMSVLEEKTHQLYAEGAPEREQERAPTGSGVCNGCFPTSVRTSYVFVKCSERWVLGKFASTVNMLVRSH